jgi:hypothetical protein
MNKGKGRAIKITEEEKPRSPTDSQIELEEIETRKAIALSLNKNKIGESSKRNFVKEESPVEFDLFKELANDTKS